MLRTNLATRPFYNERAAHVAIGIAAALVLAITSFNVVRLVTLSRHNTELSSRIGTEHAEVERLTAEAVRIRRTITDDELEQVAGAAQEANALIDQRTFSWTELFNRIESTLPPDVMLTAVRPSVKEGLTHVTMLIMAKRAQDIDEFIEKLEVTGAFEDIVPAKSERDTETGLHRAVVESIYSGLGADPAETAAATVPAADAVKSGVPPAAPSAATPPPAPAPAASRSGGRE